MQNPQKSAENQQKCELNSEASKTTWRECFCSKMAKFFKIFVKKDTATCTNSGVKGFARQAGRSMIEILGVLAIMGILSVCGLYLYTLSMHHHHANQAVDDVERLATTVYEYVEKVDKGAPIDKGDFNKNSAFDIQAYKETSTVFYVDVYNVLSGECTVMLPKAAEKHMIAVNKGNKNYYYNMEKDEKSKKVSYKTVKNTLDEICKPIGSETTVTVRFFFNLAPECEQCSGPTDGRDCCNGCLCSIATTCMQDIRNGKGGFRRMDQCCPSGHTLCGGNCVPSCSGNVEMNWETCACGGNAKKIKDCEPAEVNHCVTWGESTTGQCPCTGCEPGYHLSNGGCVADVPSCEPADKCAVWVDEGEGVCPCSRWSCTMPSTRIDHALYDTTVTFPIPDQPCPYVCEEPFHLSADGHCVLVKYCRALTKAQKASTQSFNFGTYNLVPFCCLKWNDDYNEEVDDPDAQPPFCPCTELRSWTKSENGVLDCKCTPPTCGEDEVLDCPEGARNDRTRPVCDCICVPNPTKVLYQCELPAAKACDGCDTVLEPSGCVITYHDTPGQPCACNFGTCPKLCTIPPSIECWNGTILEPVCQMSCSFTEQAQPCSCKYEPDRCPDRCVKEYRSCPNGVILQPKNCDENSTEEVCPCEYDECPKCTIPGPITCESGFVVYPKNCDENSTNEICPCEFDPCPKCTMPEEQYCDDKHKYPQKRVCDQNDTTHAICPCTYEPCCKDNTEPCCEAWAAPNTEPDENGMCKCTSYSCPKQSCAVDVDSSGHKIWGNGVVIIDNGQAVCGCLCATPSGYTSASDPHRVVKLVPSGTCQNLCPCDGASCSWTVWNGTNHVPYTRQFTNVTIGNTSKCVVYPPTCGKKEEVQGACTCVGWEVATQSTSPAVSCDSVDDCACNKFACAKKMTKTGSSTGVKANEVVKEHTDEQDATCKECTPDLKRCEIPSGCSNNIVYPTEQELQSMTVNQLINSGLTSKGGYVYEASNPSGKWCPGTSIDSGCPSGFTARCDDADCCTKTCYKLCNKTVTPPAKQNCTNNYYYYVLSLNDKIEVTTPASVKPLSGPSVPDCPPVDLLCTTLDCNTSYPKIVTDNLSNVSFIKTDPIASKYYKPYNPLRSNVCSDDYYKCPCDDVCAPCMTNDYTDSTLGNCPCTEYTCNPIAEHYDENNNFVQYYMDSGRTRFCTSDEAQAIKCSDGNCTDTPDCGCKTCKCVCSIPDSKPDNVFYPSSSDISGNSNTPQELITKGYTYNGTMSGDSCSCGGQNCPCKVACKKNTIKALTATGIVGGEIIAEDASEWDNPVSPNGTTYKCDGTAPNCPPTKYRCTIDTSKFSAAEVTRYDNYLKSLTREQLLSDAYKRFVVTTSTGTCPICPEGYQVPNPVPDNFDPAKHCDILCQQYTIPQKFNAATQAQINSGNDYGKNTCVYHSSKTKRHTYEEVHNTTNGGVVPHCPCSKWLCTLKNCCSNCTGYPSGWEDRLNGNTKVNGVYNYTWWSNQGYSTQTSPDVPCSCCKCSNAKLINGVCKIPCTIPGTMADGNTYYKYPVSNNKQNYCLDITTTTDSSKLNNDGSCQTGSNVCLLNTSSCTANDCCKANICLETTDCLYPKLNSDGYDSSYGVLKKDANGNQLYDEYGKELYEYEKIGIVNVLKTKTNDHDTWLKNYGLWLEEKNNGQWVDKKNVDCECNAHSCSTSITPDSNATGILANGVLSQKSDSKTYYRLKNIDNSSGIVPLVPYCPIDKRRCVVGTETYNGKSYHDAYEAFLQTKKVSWLIDNEYYYTDKEGITDAEKLCPPLCEDGYRPNFENTATMPDGFTKDYCIIDCKQYTIPKKFNAATQAQINSGTDYDKNTCLEHTDEEKKTVFYYKDYQDKNNIPYCPCSTWLCTLKNNYCGGCLTYPSGIDDHLDISAGTTGDNYVWLNDNGLVRSRESETIDGSNKPCKCCVCPNAVVEVENNVKVCKIPCEMLTVVPHYYNDADKAICTEQDATTKKKNDSSCPLDESLCAKDECCTKKQYLCVETSLCKYPDDIASHLADPVDMAYLTVKGLLRNNPGENCECDDPPPPPESYLCVLPTGATCTVGKTYLNRACVSYTLPNIPCPCLNGYEEYSDGTCYKVNIGIGGGTGGDGCNGILGICPTIYPVQVDRFCLYVPSDNKCGTTAGACKYVGSPVFTVTEDGTLWATNFGGLESSKLGYWASESWCTAIGQVLYRNKKRTIQTNNGKDIVLLSLLTAGVDETTTTPDSTIDTADSPNNHSLIRSRLANSSDVVDNGLTCSRVETIFRYTSAETMKYHWYDSGVSGSCQDTIKTDLQNGCSVCQNLDLTTGVCSNGGSASTQLKDIHALCNIGKCDIENCETYITTYGSGLSNPQEFCRCQACAEGYRVSHNRSNPCNVEPCTEKSCVPGCTWSGDNVTPHTNALTSTEYALIRVAANGTANQNKFCLFDARPPEGYFYQCKKSGTDYIERPGTGAAHYWSDIEQKVIMSGRHKWIVVKNVKDAENMNWWSAVSFCESQGKDRKTNKQVHLATFADLGYSESDGYFYPNQTVTSPTWALFRGSSSSEYYWLDGSLGSCQTNVLPTFVTPEGSVGMSVGTGYTTAALDSYRLYKDGYVRSDSGEDTTEKVSVQPLCYAGLCPDISYCIAYDENCQCIGCGDGRSLKVTTNTSTGAITTSCIDPTNTTPHAVNGKCRRNSDCGAGLYCFYGEAETSPTDSATVGAVWTYCADPSKTSNSGICRPVNEDVGVASKFGNRVIRRSERVMNWWSAKNFCEALGMKMVSLPDVGCYAKCEPKDDAASENNPNCGSFGKKDMSPQGYGLCSIGGCMDGEINKPYIMEELFYWHEGDEPWKSYGNYFWFDSNVVDPTSKGTGYGGNNVSNCPRVPILHADGPDIIYDVKQALYPGGENFTYSYAMCISENCTPIDGCVRYNENCECVAGYKFNNITDSTFICKEGNDCLYSFGNSCIVCERGYKLVNGSCVSCGDVDPQCSTFASGIGEACKCEYCSDSDRYAPNEDGVCTKCPTKFSASAGDFCEKRSYNSSLQRCVCEKCADERNAFCGNDTDWAYQYYLTSNFLGCSKVPKANRNCNIYKNQGVTKDCEECIPGYEAVNGECIKCANSANCRSYKNPGRSCECELCTNSISNCSRLNNYCLCAQCYSNYLSVEGVNGDGFCVYATSNNEPLWKNCVLYAAADKCAVCKPDYALSTGGWCKTCTAEIEHCTKHISNTFNYSSGTCMCRLNADEQYCETGYVATSSLQGQGKCCPKKSGCTKYNNDCTCS